MKVLIIENNWLMLKLMRDEAAKAFPVPQILTAKDATEALLTLKMLDFDVVILGTEINDDAASTTLKLQMLQAASPKARHALLADKSTCDGVTLGGIFRERRPHAHRLYAGILDSIVKQPAA